MRRYGLSDQVRAVAKDKFVTPAKQSGKDDFTIRVKGLLNELVNLGFPPNSTPLVCNAIRSERFLIDNGLEIVGIDGPPSKLSTTVVVHYRVEAKSKGTMARKAVSELDVERLEDPATRAKLLTDLLRGLLKEEIREHGGAEGFIRWIREDDEEAA
jgi:hypothetical protein